ncbi:MAG: recombination regulator RecX, partial [Pseudonocardiales bacterium]|nr:recombination regulator RecX [Pseudonocardiales bacterium]
MAVARGRSSSGGAEDSDKAGDDPESVARIICLQLLTDRPRTRSELAAVLHRR